MNYISLLKLRYVSHETNLDKQMSQMRAPLAASREPAGDQNRQLKMP